MNAPTPKPWIEGISAYVPGQVADAKGRPLVKLSANENPLGTSPKAMELLAQDPWTRERYPDPDANALRAALAKAHGLKADCIVCGTGSDELLNLAAQAFAGPDDEVIYVRYGFSVYDIAARRCGAAPVVAPDSGYGTDIDALLDAVTPRTKLVFLANPNNPTGTLSSRAEIARLHAALPSDVLLVLDQAYAEYLSQAEEDGGMALAQAADNVLVTRTFSKIYGLAGERIGWATGAARLIETLNRIRGPFNVTATGQAMALAALADHAFVEASRAHNLKWRHWLTEELGSMGNYGLKPVPSHANFVLVPFEGEISAEAAQGALAQAGYAVRRLPGQGLGHALRITVGTEEQNRAVVDTLRGFLVR